MIYLVTSRKDKYDKDKLAESGITIQTSHSSFRDWVKKFNILQLDTETSMTEDGPMQHINRKLYVVQLGDPEGDDQYIFDMVNLSILWKGELLHILKSDKEFICHNARFEYVVFQVALNIKIENLHDTYLMSLILNTGLELHSGYHSLKGCLRRFFNIELSKEEQTTFNGDLLTINQIIYAATDVVATYDLFTTLKTELNNWNLWYLYNEVERKVLKVYGDMELTTMRFDKIHWDKLTQNFIIEANDLENELNILVSKDPILIQYLQKSGPYLNGTYLVQPKDEYKLNWASTIFKRSIFKILAPSLPAEIKTKPQLKKYLKDTTNIPLNDRLNLDLYMKREYSKLDKLLITNYHDFLEDNQYFLPKGKISINWASSQHKLYIFKHYYPNLDDTNAVTLKKIRKNELINVFKKWAEINKRVTSYGGNFQSKYTREDGTIAPINPRQILATGRISFGILLQMPAEAKFRNAFLPPAEDWRFIDTDYSSMEVVIAAFAAKEAPFLNAIKHGWDLHSMSASYMFAKEWKDMAEPNCEHIKSKKRCTCKAHSKFRDFSKTITFGLFYGIGPTGLADRLGVSIGEAKDLIKKFFTAFPKFNKFFSDNERFAINNLRIIGLPPTNRIRFYHYPEYESDKGTIGRSAKNFPIQEANASILKIAMIKLRQEILDRKLNFKIHLPIHDEILSSCHKDDVKSLIELQERCMIEAADEFLIEGLTKVETNILNRWTK